MVDGRIADEKELVDRAIQGESSAFGLLYDRYQPAIYRFIYLKVGHREEAEDLTHQVFLKAWENIERFRNEGLPISSWLYRIARNRIIDHYRTKKTTFEFDEAVDEALQHMEDISDAAGKKMALEEAYSALRTLPQEQQDIILMRFVEELTVPEIADILGKNQGTVRVLQHRALKSLKKALEKQNHEDA
jgi:RNA polymerase sigma-70 factor (ECF subfamily)